jgi:hypothetical protein
MNFNRWAKLQGADFLNMRLRRLPAGLFKFFYFVRCLAACNGGATLPPVEQIAFLLGSRAPAVERRLAALREAGLIAEEGGVLRIVESDDDGAAEVPAEPLSGAERSRRWRDRRAAACDAERNEAATPRDEQEIDIEEDQETDSSRVTRAGRSFEEFFEAFPRREGDNPEAPARAAWRKAIGSGAKPAEIIAGARAYAAATADRERKFIASAGRWLSEERWRASGLPKSAGGAAAELPGVWIEVDSPEWGQWAAWWRASKGKGPPVDSRGGWRFPSLSPPDAARVAA